VAHASAADLAWREVTNTSNPERALAKGGRPRPDGVALYGEEYVDKGAQYYEDQLRQQRRTKLNRDAAALGLTLVPIQN
jgi:hypothetical protein